ncbi:MAG: glycosyltransferase family 2 protein [Phycisphaerae bacterium]
MISVLTVNYHSSAELERLAESLRCGGHENELELIITNNSVEDVIRIPSTPALPVVVLPSPNLGFATGINLALREARGEVLFITNPDVTVTSGALDRAACFLHDHPDVGILLPMLRYPDGTVQSSVRRFYTWPVILYARSPFRALRYRPPFFRRYLYHGLDLSKPQEVDWGLGGAMFLRRAECGPNGLFDERFFLYFEDVDLCHRVWAGGRRVVYHPEIGCVHDHRRLSRLPLSKAGWHHFRSLISFIAKYGGLPPSPRQ